MMFAARDMMVLLGLIPLALGLMVWGHAVRKKRRVRFMQQIRWAQSIPSFHSGRRFWKQGLWLGALVLVLIAVLRPQFGVEMKPIARSGQDVFILLDVSKSMNTKDVLPSRLLHAKQEIMSLIQNLKGDRVGLIAFAGESFVYCPLTVDYSAVRLLLQDLQVGSVPVLGTDLASAIKMARVNFEKQPKRRRKLMLVFSDGENFENDPVESATLAGKSDIVIYTVGVGTSNGEPIPEYNEAKQLIGFKKGPDHQIVVSKLNEALLQRVAQVTGGAYFRSDQSQFVADALYQDVTRLEGAFLEEEMKQHRKEQYALFLVAALVFLGVDFLLSERRRVREVDT